MQRLVRRLAAALGTGEDIDAVIRGAGVVMIIQVLGSALAYTTHVLLARWMGPFEFGVFVYAWSWATILPVVSSLGLNKAIVRFIPEYMAKKEWDRLSGVIRRTRLFVFAGGIVLVTVPGCLLIITLADRIADYYRVPLYIGLASVPLLALLSLYSEMSRGFGWAGMAYSPPLLIRPALFLVAAAALSLLAWPQSGTTVLILAALASLLTVVIQAVIFERDLPASVREARPSYHSRLWLRISLPVFLSEGMLLVLWQVDVLMLGGITGPESVAIYNASMKTAGLVVFVFNALVALAVPRFASVHAEGDREKLQAFVHGVARWIFWPSVVVVIGVLVAGKLILSAFGPSFVGGYPMLVVLTIGFLLWALTGPTSGYLIASGNQDSIVLPNITAAIQNIVLNALLIPRFGGLGAATASFVSLALLTVWFYVLVRRRLGISAIFFSARRSA